MTTPAKLRRRKAATESRTCPEHAAPSDAFIINKAQLILAEKRTSMATMRFGIAVFILPLSVLGLLVATSGHHDVVHELSLIVPLGIMLTGLIALGSVLVVRPLRNIQRYDRKICRLKACHGRLSRFLD